MSHDEVVVHSVCNNFGYGRRIKFDKGVMLGLPSLIKRTMKMEPLSQKSLADLFVARHAQTSNIPELRKVSPELVLIESMW